MALYRCTETTTPITPSDSSPVAMSANTGYKPTTNGYAIASEPTSITPSDSSPASLSSSGIYKPSTSGYAIKNSPSSKTPSDTSPVSVTSGSIIKPSAAGYLVKTVSNIGLQPDKYYTANNVGTSGTTTITVTKKPRYAFVSAVAEANSNYIGLYLIDFTKSKAWYFYKGGSSASFTNSDYSSNISTMFPTVSSSQVVYQNSAFNTTKRLVIALYY